MERIGSALMDQLDTISVARSAPVIALRAMEADVAPAAIIVRDAAADVPVPLQHLIGPRLGDIRWKRLGMGIWHMPLSLSRRGDGDLRLLRVAPGQAMPEHGHGGAELTLMLQGSYRDVIGDYQPGDVADLDDEVEHRPIADPETGCICIIASEKRARFKGLFGRMVQPLTGM